MDPAKAPAVELAALDPQRWEFQTALDELKTHQRGPGVVLRSRSSELVNQEVWGDAAGPPRHPGADAPGRTDGGLDPDRLSFSRSLRVIRRQTAVGLEGPGAVAQAIAEISERLLPSRRLRAFPRVVKRKMSNFGVKRARHLAPADHPRRRRGRHRGASRPTPTKRHSHVAPTSPTPT